MYDQTSIVAIMAQRSMKPEFQMEKEITTLTFIMSLLGEAFHAHHLIVVTLLQQIMEQMLLIQIQSFYLMSQVTGMEGNSQLTTMKVLGHNLFPS